MKIGIIADLLGQPLFESLALAKQLGADGVQLYAVGARWNLMEFTAEQLAAVAQECKNLGLEVSAVCGDLGGHAFQFRHENPERIRKTKQIFDIAEALGAKVVTGHIGVIPDDPACDRFAILCEALREVAAYASSKGMARIETYSHTALILHSIDDIGKMLKTVSEVRTLTCSILQNSRNTLTTLESHAYRLGYAV